MPLVVFLVLPVGQHAEVYVASVLVPKGVIEQKIGIGRHVLFFQADYRPLLPVALDLHLVRG